MTTDIVKVEEQPSGALVQLVAEPARILESWKQFEALKKQLLSDKDYQTYTERGVQKRFIKKSGWRVIASAFGLSLAIVDRQVDRISEDWIVVRYTVRATAPGGMRYSDGVGSCDSHEDRFEETIWENKQKVKTGRYVFKFNDVDGTAYTRAANRAISDLVGGGEVSAEEIQAEDLRPDQLPKNYQDRLLQLAQGVANGMRALGGMVFEQGVTSLADLTKEQATAIGKELAKQPAGKPQVVEATVVQEVDPIDEEF